MNDYSNVIHTSNRDRDNSLISNRVNMMLIRYNDYI